MAFFPKADHSIVQLGPDNTPEPVSVKSITVGETSTQIGFWGSKSIGTCSDPNVTRLSITKSNNSVFLDYMVDPSSIELILKINGLSVLLTYSSGRFVASNQGGLRTLFDNNVGQSITYTIEHGGV